MKVLPSDICKEIFSLLDPKSLLNISSTEKYILNICNNKFYYNYINKNYSHIIEINILTLDKFKVNNWKELLIRLNMRKKYKLTDFNINLNLHIYFLDSFKNIFKRFISLCDNPFYCLFFEFKNDDNRYDFYIGKDSDGYISIVTYPNTLSFKYDEIVGNCFIDNNNLFDLMSGFKMLNNNYYKN
jgi:hypothetical protein